MYPIIELFGIKTSVYSLVLLVAISICILVFIANRKYRVGYIDKIVRCLVVALIGATIFGRLLSALTLMQTSSKSFAHNILYGGFVFFGGIIGGFAGVFFYCKTRSQSVIDFSDVFLGLVPLGQAIGRVGCYFNGCCYGLEHDGVFSVPYIIEQTQTRVLPTWFFESAFCLLLAVFFQVICDTTTRGIHTAIYCITYSSFRFFIEFFRGDVVRGIYGWMSTSQIISGFLFVMGIYLLISSKKNAIENYLLCKRRIRHES